MTYSIGLESSISLFSTKSSIEDFTTSQSLDVSCSLYGCFIFTVFMYRRLFATCNIPLRHPILGDAMVVDLNSFIGGDNHCRNLFNVMAMSPGNAIDLPAISSGIYSSCGRLSVM